MFDLRTTMASAGVNTLDLQRSDSINFFPACNYRRCSPDSKVAAESDTENEHVDHLEQNKQTQAAHLYRNLSCCRKL